mgnify:CR=1 FL=1
MPVMCTAPVSAFTETTEMLSNRIESRPAHGALWQYAFFIDVGGHVEESPLKEALADIHAEAGDVRVLGSYPVAVL